MTNNYAFKTQIASIMEVLANTAVAEICKLIDNDYAVLRLEISQSQNENRMLKRKVQMMELKMARERAERTIRECVPSARSRGRTSVMERNKGWRGGGHFVTRDRLLASQGESSWRGRRCFTEDQPAKRTSGVEESTVTELEGSVILIKEESPEAVLQEPVGTSWKRVVGPACDGMVLPTATAEPLASSSAEQPGSRHNVVEAVKADIDLPLTKMDEHQERQTDAASSFILTGFKESELAVNDSVSTLGPTRELSVPPPMEHSVFSSVVKMESEEASSCSELNRPSTSEGQWPGPVGVDWSAGLASEQTQDHGSTSDTLESSDMFSTVSHIKMENHHVTDVEGLGVYSVERATNFTTGSMFPVPDMNQQCLSQKSKMIEDGVLNPADPTLTPITTPIQRCGKKRPEKKHERKKHLTCSVCGLQTRCPADLVIHQRVHTGERPYCCTVCPARFTQKGYLNVHMRGHTGEKPYRCLCCGKCFSMSFSLKTHMRLHTGEKPFSCSYCDKSFASSKYLKKHQRRVHTGMMFTEESSY